MEILAPRTLLVGLQGARWWIPVHTSGAFWWPIERKGGGGEAAEGDKKDAGECF